MRSSSIPLAVDSLRRIMRGMRIAAQETQMATGLGAAQLFVLRALDDEGETSLSTLASRTMTDRTSVAAVVDRLTAAGLVRRGTSAADRRRAAVSITRRGRQVLHRAPAPPTARVMSALASLPPRRRAAVATALAHLAAAMGVDGAGSGFLSEELAPSVRSRYTTSTARRRASRPTGQVEPRK